jgi:hypothetical protein
VGSFTGRVSLKITYSDPAGDTTTLGEADYDYAKPGETTQIKAVVAIAQLSGLHWLNVRVNGRVLMRAPIRVDMLES